MRKLIAVIASLMIVTSATATDGVAALNTFYRDVHSMRADFVQYQTDDAGKVMAESSGVIMLQRPGKLRLDYKKPYEQMYLSDGKKLWHYDVDLAQVIVKPLDQGLGDTPMLLLMGKENLYQRFNVRPMPGKQDKDLAWVELIPKNIDAMFAVVRIAFADGGELRIMQLEDRLGNNTFIQFHNIQKNISHGYKTFRFTPPAGVDVIEQ
jgi:outer membrane lipoprotein carrier protein